MIKLLSTIALMTLLAGCNISIDTRQFHCDQAVTEERASFVSECLSNVDVASMKDNLIATQYGKVITECQTAAKELYCGLEEQPR